MPPRIFLLALLTCLTPCCLTPWVVAQEAAEAAEDAPRLLFIRSGAGLAGGLECPGKPGESLACQDEQSASIHNHSSERRNHGWGTLAKLLEEAGFLLEERQEGPWDNPAPVPFETLPLHRYSAIILASNNNADYSREQIDAVERYLRHGGGLLVISDANFGPTATAAMISDQLFLDRFGLTMNRDRGTYPSERQRDFTSVGQAHPILAGVDSFTGEGVSPITIDPEATPEGASFQILATARQVLTPRGESRPPTEADATLLAGTVERGRLVAFYDRNTFFNRHGAGADIHQHDNAALAVNLFRWLVQLPPAAETP